MTAAFDISDGKLKKLVARAVEVNSRRMESVAPQAAN
jgi:hypothetical protein